ncbi:GINS complex subunit [Tulasnella sp. 424]|nr:GINS complex subunit [Tulasnella sp. 424]KAG8973700.1 GINS complex subunit [Tulasnella sp. 425]
MDFSDATLDDHQFAVDTDEDPIARLIRAWLDERHAPDLLVFQAALIDDLMQKLHEQGLVVSALQSDESTTEEEHLRITLVKTDMERAKFLIRSYMRVRLHKIEKYAAFILQTPEEQQKLSNAELLHAQRYEKFQLIAVCGDTLLRGVLRVSFISRYQQMLANHFHATVLDALPESTHALDQTFPDGTSMSGSRNLFSKEGWANKTPAALSYTTR